MIVPSEDRIKTLAGLMGLDYLTMTNTEKFELIKFVQNDALQQAQLAGVKAASDYYAAVTAYYEAATTILSTQEKLAWAQAWFQVQSVKRWAGIQIPIPPHLSDFN